MNRRSVPAWLLAVSLALNAGIVVAVALHQMQPPTQAGAARPSAVNLPDYLELSPEQRQRWQQLEPAFLSDLAANWADIRRHREALVRHIFADPPQRAAIDAEQSRIAALQDAQQQRVIVQLLAERALLDDGQRARLMALLLSRYAQESTEEELLHRD
ncbi:periplasmic heavy metal sensor [Acidovorax sp.]|uniref:Spy/CpxP family protein refolding chaperone n=1 Tax=Acidovorax sp. TaxID=1872122 RepID=UPI00258F0CEA|nr:periplasmic heavy metal sensor [Acidovorax sp.]